MAEDNERRIELLKTLKNLRDSKMITSEEITSMCVELFDRKGVGDMTVDELETLVEEINKIIAAKQGITMVPPKKAKKTQTKREILTLEDYAKQYDISKMFLTMIRNRRTGEEKPFILRAGLLYKMDKKYGKNGYEIIAEPIKLLNLSS